MIAFSSSFGHMSTLSGTLNCSNNKLNFFKLSILLLNSRICNIVAAEWKNVCSQIDLLHYVRSKFTVGMSLPQGELPRPASLRY